jgi:hypothetical protein
MAENHDAVASFQAVDGPEITAEQRLDLERFEDLRFDAGA